MSKKTLEEIKAIIASELCKTAQISVSSLEKQDSKYCIELEFYSPAGEDVIITIWFDGTWGDFVDKFHDYDIEFDADEHAEMWLQSRGKNGVPSSIRELIDDADNIQKSISNWATNLEYDKYDDDWEEIKSDDEDGNESND